MFKLCEIEQRLFYFLIVVITTLFSLEVHAKPSDEDYFYSVIKIESAHGYQQDLVRVDQHNDVLLGGDYLAAVGSGEVLRNGTIKPPFVQAVAGADRDYFQADAGEVFNFSWAGHLSSLDKTVRFQVAFKMFGNTTIDGTAYDYLSIGAYKDPDHFGGAFSASLYESGGGSPTYRVNDYVRSQLPSSITVDLPTTSVGQIGFSARASGGPRGGAIAWIDPVITIDPDYLLTHPGLTVNVSSGIINAGSVVPEPETYAMLLTGLILVSFFARRKYRKA